MSFGGFGSSGFGSNNNNNNQTSTGFGGFGSTSTPAFGSNTGGGFGANNNNNNTSGGGLFGAGASSNTGFGSGGFGSNNTSSPFGQNKTGFGQASTAGGSLFGGGTATSGGFGSGGGFGTSNNTGFGASASNTGFGGTANKTAFGSNTGGGLFGSNNTASTGFGANANTNNTTNTSGGFGGGLSFGANNTNAAAKVNNGTGTTQFSPHTEKEANSSTTNAYQTITAMPAYKEFSQDELRVVDYMQGRKYGNSTGQAGAFGASTGFGGFGGNNNNTTTQSTGFGSTANNTGGGLFGSTANNNNNNNNNTTPSLFGQNNQQSTGFGSTNTAGGGLFGAKPATGGGLFGSTATTSAQSGGGLFGTAGASTGFGNNNNNASTGFGANNNTTGFGATQNKPLFGASTTNTGGFGTGNTGGGLFGGAANNNTTSAFGNNTQQNNTSGGFSFANNNNNQQQSGQTGGGLFGGGFGNNANNNQQKPGGLFGASTNTGGGLFGSTNNQNQQSGGLFGNNNNNQQQSGGLFGAKPAATGGLFGQSTNTANTGGGLFGGNNQQQQNTGGGLFGGNNNQSGGLFGKPAQPAGGSSLFGGNNNQQGNTGAGLFGGSQNQNQNAGSSLFGSTNQQPLQQSQNNHFTASLIDNPYGNTTLFANLQTPTQSLGPLATPLSSSTQKTKKQAILPVHRVAPNASSRLMTPQTRPQGYGFSYSNYNSPQSPNNASPLGLNSSLLQGSVGRALGKSLSTSNLRHSFSAQDSILAPGAFSAATRSGAGSMKKLNVNRNLTQRRSLFSPDSSVGPNTKRVSFENGSGQTPPPAPAASSGALVPFGNQGSSPAQAPASPAETNGHGKELAIVPESTDAAENPLVTKNRQARLLHEDQTPGEYSIEPSVAAIQAMSREERAHIKNLRVSREGVGYIEFSEVDLNGTPLDQICGHIVEMKLRSATVYGPASPVRTPPLGQGLNVPSKIVLENSWPRKKGGRLKVPQNNDEAIAKHVRLLKACQDTHFQNYDSQTGIWAFTVDHFTTYELVYGDEDDSIMTNTVSHESDSPADTRMAEVAQTQDATPIGQDHTVNSFASSQGSSMDDTFDFKKGKQKHLPGQFDNGALDHLEYYEEDDNVDHDQLGAYPSFDTNNDDFQIHDAPAEDQDFAVQLRTDDLMNFDPTASIPALQAEAPLAAPVQQPTPKKSDPLVLGANWTEHLQQTVSPMKRERPAPASEPQEEIEEPEQQSAIPQSIKAGFGSTVDIMKSLFGQSQETAPRLKVPTSKSPQKVSKRGTSSDSNLISFRETIHSANGVRAAKFASKELLVPSTIELQQQKTDFLEVQDTVPQAVASQNLTIADLAANVSTRTVTGQHELDAWRLADILFVDDLSSVPSTATDAADFAPRIRKDRLSEYWRHLVHQDVESAVQFAKSAEEKALMYLSGGNIPDACAALLSGNNFHLAQMVAQLPGDQTFRNTIETQIEVWQKRSDWSEMSDAVRAIYEILAGSTAEVRGVSKAGPENKAETFKISLRFRFDWKRAFGLRLWYGTSQVDDIARAVESFFEDLAADKEQAFPAPWFITTKEDVGYQDPESDSREDILWGLLQLYADLTNRTDPFEEKSKYEPLADVNTVLCPENTSGDPLDARFSFQLINVLGSYNVIDFEDPVVQNAAKEIALEYATALSSQIATFSDLLATTTWVLLHIEEPEDRVHRITALLNEHADLLDAADNSIGQILVNDLHIPYKWLCSARARYAETVEHDHIMQTKWLIEGEELTTAHNVFCRHIGPDAIIGLDYASIREIAGALSNTDIVRVVDWDKGAGMYLDFAELLELEAGGTRTADAKARAKKLVKKLATALDALSGEVVSGEVDRLEGIALKLMAEQVADIGHRENALESERLLRLPLTESGYLKQSLALSLDYYNALLVKV